MIVPVSKDQTSDGSGLAQMPSETNLLLALAEMHRQGRFQVAGDVIDKSKEFLALQRANRYENAGGFRPGAPSAKVLPVEPKLTPKPEYDPRDR